VSVDQQEQPSLPPDASADSQSDAAHGPADLAVDDLQREIEVLRDKNLRLLADMRNLQQRAQREREEALKYAEADFARDLLVVLDDLDRAMQASVQSDDATTLREGVRIAHEHFVKVLRSRGIEPVPAVGLQFDPGQHEALMQQPSDTSPAGTVIQEIARGYRMHNRVIRPARVVVSSGPPPAS